MLMAHQSFTVSGEDLDIQPFQCFLRATVDTAMTRLSHRNSLCPSVRLSLTRVDQSTTMQARITKSSMSAAW